MPDKDVQETKAQRFGRLAQSRTNRALKDVRLIGNLAKKSTYEFTPEQVRKIAAALNAEVRAMKSRFDDALSDSDGGFRL